MYIRIRKAHLLSEIQRSLNPISDFRNYFQIAIIDDKPLSHYSILLNHNFRIKELGDISDIAAISEYPIILCDIRNVGVQFASAYGGAHVIYEIKKRYPDKYIIAYSAGANDS